MTAFSRSSKPPPDAPGINIEWFRPDPRKALVRSYAIGLFILLSGMTCCAAGFLGLRTDSGRSETGFTLLLVLGVVTVALAMVVFVRGALGVLADETCLILRVDGVRFVRSGAATQVPWEVIEAIRADGDALCIDTDDPALGQIRVKTRFTDIDAEELAERIIKTRRRALMGLL